MSIELETFKVANEAERMYMYTQSSQIQGQTGCIGHLRADMDTDGKGFFSSWNDHRGYLKNDEFKAEFDNLINSFRFDDEWEGILKSRNDLAKFCYSHPAAAFKDGKEFGFRADTEKYSYMLRLNPNKGEYNLYCYCYRRDWLDQHMREAEKGIRFIDSNYNDLFKIPDGGKIKITYPDGDTKTEVCRYIDPYHLEVGFGSCNLYHICEFAERMENNRAKVEPIDKFCPNETKLKNTKAKENER